MSQMNPNTKLIVSAAESYIVVTLQNDVLDFKQSVILDLDGAMNLSEALKNLVCGRVDIDSLEINE